MKAKNRRRHTGDGRQCFNRPISAHASDHAILRYLERIKGVDITAVVAEMLGEGRAAAIKALRTCKLPLGEGARLVVVDRVVVTVLDND